MTKETKIGLLSVIVIAIMVWGYMFLKGRNLLSKSKTFYTIYKDVTDLNISSPVMINGFKIGTITDIKPDPANVKQMIVSYVVEGDYGIPKDAVAVLYTVGVIGGRAISIEYNKVCSGENCAENKDTLKGKSRGILDSMLGGEDIDKYSSELTTSAKSIIANIGKDGETGPINETIRQLEIISKNLAALSHSGNQLIEANSKSIQITLANISKVSQALANNQQNIDHIIKNLDTFTSDLGKSNIDQTVTKVNKTMDSAVVTIDELKTTLSQTSKSLDNLQSILGAIKNGEGSAGKLIYDPHLYTNLNATTKELSLLLQDLRLNPKRYAHFSVFGKKQQEYTNPEDDPAKDK